MGDAPEPSRRSALIALLAVVLLVLGGLWISGALRRTGAVQDCVMAGRTNCAPIRQ